MWNKCMKNMGVFLYAFETKPNSLLIYFMAMSHLQLLFIISSVLTVAYVI